MKLRILPVLAALLLSVPCQSQGFLHASGKRILNGDGQEVILRGIGTGNWMLQEGYMMKSADVAGTHTAFRNKLTETIGPELTAGFYEAWLNNHFTRADADSMKSWGFNSVRVAMHYKWFTLPIEDEPVVGQDTWFEEGFIRIDSLLSWCSANEMYLILDLHGAPGGQGKDANISDYDPSKLSLWESSENRRKTVALWARLAERYASEPWIGGYDLINEPNWDLPGNTLLRQLYGEITGAVRAVDTNHMIIVEGNWFANDYSGLTPPWDDNMVYSFHKYWTFNTQQEINWIINLRNTWNVPVWLGESGENSNSWFTGLIALCEQNGIGWSWWPVKKAGINNVLQVPESVEYNNLINYWKTGNPVMTPDRAFAAVMEWAENHRIENCTVKRDVIDALIRQPFTSETLPFRIYRPGEPIHAVNYDLGRSGQAYLDQDSANYHLSTGNHVNWNLGWVYRNDGVDIGVCNDSWTGSPGYHVGWTTDGEWLQYTLSTDSAAAFTLKLRVASNSNSPAVIRMLTDGEDIIAPLTIASTGGGQAWQTKTVQNVIIPAGEHKLRLHFTKGGANINLFWFEDPKPDSSVPFRMLHGGTSGDGTSVILHLNKPVTEMNAGAGDFQVTANGVALSVTTVENPGEFPKKLILNLETPAAYGQQIRVSYTGSGIFSNGQQLEQFANVPADNNLPVYYTIPARIEAEDYHINYGFQPESCSDTGGGINMGYASNGDYLDYLIRVPAAGEYLINFRIASQYSNGRISIRVSKGSYYQTVGTLEVAATGGWQSWKNQGIKVFLPEGDLTLRFFSFAGEYNINWFGISSVLGMEEGNTGSVFRIYPNPGNGLLKVIAGNLAPKPASLQVTDLNGRAVFHSGFPSGTADSAIFDLRHLAPGLYIIHLVTGNHRESHKVLLNSDRF